MKIRFRGGVRDAPAGRLYAEVDGARPAFYALERGGWRDYVTLLHPPYTAWHLSYVVIGGCLAPAIAWERRSPLRCAQTASPPRSSLSSSPSASPRTRSTS